jgi:hypothetical protein
MKGSDWLIVLGALTIVAAGGFYWLAAMAYAFGGEWEGVWSRWVYALPAVIFAAAFFAAAFRLYRNSRTKAR